MSIIVTVNSLLYLAMAVLISAQEQEPYRGAITFPAEENATVLQFLTYEVSWIDVTSRNAQKLRFFLVNAETLEIAVFKDNQGNTEPVLMREVNNDPNGSASGSFQWTVANVKNLPRKQRFMLAAEFPPFNDYTQMDVNQKLQIFSPPFFIEAAASASQANAVDDAEQQVSDAALYIDRNGNLHLDPPGRFDGTVFVGGVDVMELSRKVDSLWRLSPYGPRLYAIGGNHGSSYIDRVEVFDGFKWTKVASPMPNPRFDFGTAVFKGIIYIIGGVRGIIYAAVDTFDGHEWSSAPPLNDPRAEFACAVYKDKLFVAGGYDYNGQQALGSVEVFDGKSWAFAPAMLAKRSYHGAVVFEDKLYAIAGGGLRSVEAFDGNSWVDAPPVPEARAAFGTAVFHDRIFVVGGFAVGNVALNSVITFSGTTWTSAPPMPTARRTFGLAVFHDRMYAVGGWNSTTTFDTVESFDGSVWTRNPALLAARHQLGVAVLPEEDT